MYRVCVAPYPTGTQPVTKTLLYWPTGLIISALRRNFLRFTFTQLTIYIISLVFFTNIIHKSMDNIYVNKNK